MYRYETKTMMQKDKKRFEAFQIWEWRNWTERVTNENSKQKKTNLLNLIKNRRGKKSDIYFETAII